MKTYKFEGKVTDEAGKDYQATMSLDIYEPPTINSVSAMPMPLRRGEIAEIRINATADGGGPLSVEVQSDKGLLFQHPTNPDPFVWYLNPEKVVTENFVINGSVLDSRGQLTGFEEDIYLDGRPWFGTAYADLKALPAFEVAIGAHFEILRIYHSTPGTTLVGPKENYCFKNGITPFSSWRMDMEKVASGQMDATIRMYAQSVKATNKPWYLCFYHEVDRSGDGATFIKAWKRIRQIFGNEDAKNVKWVWTTTAYLFNPSNKKDDEYSFYPGQDWVDVLAVDGYNWFGQRPGQTAWQDPLSVFGGAYNFAYNEGLAFGIGEFNSGVDPKDPQRRPKWLLECWDLFTSWGVEFACLFPVNMTGSGETANWTIGLNDPAIAALKKMRGLS